MKGYWYAIEWIAQNDEPLDKNIESIRGYISTGLIADLFNKKASRVAEDIKMIRDGNMTLKMWRAIQKRKI